MEVETARVAGVAVDLGAAGVSRRSSEWLPDSSLVKGDLGFLERGELVKIGICVKSGTSCTRLLALDRNICV